MVNFNAPCLIYLHFSLFLWSLQKILGSSCELPVLFANTISTLEFQTVKVSQLTSVLVNIVLHCNIFYLFKFVPLFVH